MDERETGHRGVAHPARADARSVGGGQAAVAAGPGDGALTAALANSRACEERDRCVWELLSQCVGVISIDALVAAFGPGALDAVAALREADAIAGSADSLQLTAPALQAARLSWSKPSAAVCAALARLHEHVGAMPPSPTRLLLACSALIGLGRAEEALAELERAAEWRHAMPIEPLQALAARIGAAAAQHRAAAQRLLAREHLYRGQPRRALLALEDAQNGDEEALLLRSAALVRVGTGDEARLLLEECERRRPTPAQGLMLAELDMLSGDIDRGRARVLAMDECAEQEARRATLMAFAAALEQDHGAADGEVARARARLSPSTEPSGMLLLLVGVLLSESDEIDRLRLLAQSAPPGSRPGQVLQLLARLRQGDLRGCLGHGEPLLRDCEREGDRLYWVVAVMLCKRAPRMASVS